MKNQSYAEELQNLDLASDWAWFLMIVLFILLVGSLIAEHIIQPWIDRREASKEVQYWVKRSMDHIKRQDIPRK